MQLPFTESVDHQPNVKKIPVPFIKKFKYFSDRQASSWTNILVIFGSVKVSVKVCHLDTAAALQNCHDR